MLCLKRLNFGLGCEKPECFVTSQWQKSSKPSVNFVIFRVAITSYFIFVLIFSLITAAECNQLKFYAIYLTNWNVMMNAFSTFFGTILAVLYYRKKITFDDDEHCRMPVAMKCYWIISTLSTVVCISLSCVYWPLIHNGRDKGLNDSLTHAGNAIVLFTDIFINAQPPRYGHFVFPLGYGIVYNMFSLFYTLLGGTDRDGNNFIYSVIDWNAKTTGAFLFSLGTIIFLTIMHFVLTFLASQRVRLSEYVKIRRAQTPNAESNSDFNDI